MKPNQVNIKTHEKANDPLSLTFRLARMGSWSLNVASNTLIVSDQTMKMFGLESEYRDDIKAAIGKIQDISSREKLLSAIRESTGKKTAFDIEMKLNTAGKIDLWVRVFGFPVIENDKCIEISGFLQDISEKKLAEEALIESNTRLSALIRNLKAGILFEDENRRIVYVNDSLCRLFRISTKPDDLIGSDSLHLFMKMKELFTEPEKYMDRLQSVYSAGETQFGEELLLKDKVVYEVDFVPVKINETSKGQLWKFTDLSVRKNQEMVFRQQEEKYRNLIDNMNIGLTETDNEDVMIYMNHMFCRMSGYTKEELTGKKFTDFIIEESYRGLIKEKNALRKSGISDIYQHRVTTKSGETRWWMTGGGPNYDNEGNITGTIGISVDLTDQKTLELELDLALKKAEESAKAKEIFLATMSHEIRTPLNAIIGIIREMSRKPLPPEQGFLMVNAGMASQHLLSIVNNVLDITKIESRQIDLNLRPFSLVRIISDAVSIMTISADEKMLIMSTMISPDISAAYIGDSDRIRQVLLNILGNSVKFTEKGNISVECLLKEKTGNFHKILIRISDTGIGIDDTYLKNIFQKFSSRSFSGEGKYSGTGLGMAISRELVDIMNGEISIESHAGKGTIVEIILNLEITDEKEITISIDPGTFTELKGRRILLAEDNFLNRLVAVNSLTYFGMDVTETVNGKEAIEKLRNEAFDLVLMDLQMPEMGGLEATRIIRNELKLDMPVIALTAHALKAEIDRCFKSGMNDYVAKPFDENTLIGTIQKYLSGKASAIKNDSTGSTGEKLFDLKILEGLSRGNNDFMNKLIGIFCESTPADIKTIKLAMENGDLDTVKSVAHRIKPNLANFGLQSLAVEIRDIEKLAEQGINDSVLADKVRYLELTVIKVIEELSRIKY
jgi:two-component system, sensor histidine kinase